MKVCWLPIALVINLVILVLRPIVIIQTYAVDWPFGHVLATPHANQVRNSQWNRTHWRKKLTIYCFFGPVTSDYALKKIGENVPVVRGNLAWLIDRFAKVIPNTQIYHHEDVNIQHYGDLAPLIKFSETEIKAGETFIEPYQSSFVCLNVRDSAYNKKLQQDFQFPAKTWGHRDSDIQTYIKASEHLAQNGYTVFRMGAAVNAPLVSSSAQVIDYATNGMRTEFLDFYLGSKCEFAVSTASGWDDIPVIFNRPIMLVNVYDFFNEALLRRNCFIYPKIFLSPETRNVLKLQDFFDLVFSDKFAQVNYDLKYFGVTIQDLSSEELVEAVTEMAQRVEGTFVETPKQKELQAKLKHILSTHPKLQPSPNFYPVRALFASCFLSRYPNFLDGLD